MPRLKTKKLTDTAKLPEKARRGDLGYDLFSAEDILINPSDTVAVATGIAVIFPEGYGAVIKDRSSMAVKKIVTSAGVIDNGYRGEIKIVLTNNSDKAFRVEAGLKIAQMVPVKVTDWEVVAVDNLDETERGEGGFGSTGR